VGDGELLKLGVDVAQSTVAKYMVPSCRHRARTGRPSCATTLDRRDGSARPGDDRLGSFMHSRSWTMIAGVSSQWRSHPIPRPNGLRGRSREPFHGKRHRNTCFATATPSMGTSTGNGSTRWVSAIGPPHSPSPWQNGYIERLVGFGQRRANPSRRPSHPDDRGNSNARLDSTTITFGPSFGKHTPCRSPHRKE
jgi:hypothetical protein